MPPSSSELHDLRREVKDDLSEMGRNLYQKIDALSEVVAKSVAQCGVCHKMVVGNGQPGFHQRLSQVEGVVDSVEDIKKQQRADHDQLITIAAERSAAHQIGWKTLTLIVSVTGIAVHLIGVVSGFVAKML